MVFLVQCSHTERMNSTVQSNPRELDQTSVWFQSEHLAFSPVQFRHKPSNCTANQSNNSQLQSKSPVFPLAPLPPLHTSNPLLSCLFPAAFDKWSISFKVCKLIKFIIRSKSDKLVPTFTVKNQQSTFRRTILQSSSVISVQSQFRKIMYGPVQSSRTGFGPVQFSSVRAK